MSVAPLRRTQYEQNKEILRVDGDDKIVRDKYSKALLLNDVKVLQEYERKCKERIEKHQVKDKLAELEYEVAGLKDDISEIKQLLQAIVNR